MLIEAFETKGITLPETMDVLDVGAGHWSYVSTLYDFLRFYEDARTVNLTGIDRQGELPSRSRINYLSSFKLPHLQ